MGHSQLYLRILSLGMTIHDHVSSHNTPPGTGTRLAEAQPHPGRASFNDDCPVAQHFAATREDMARSLAPRERGVRADLVCFKCIPFKGFECFQKEASLGCS